MTKWLRCPECSGQGTVLVGRRGGNDPDVVDAECYDCGGRGEVAADEPEEEEDA